MHVPAKRPLSSQPTTKKRILNTTAARPTTATIQSTKSAATKKPVSSNNATTSNPTTASKNTNQIEAEFEKMTEDYYNQRMQQQQYITNHLAKQQTQPPIIQIVQQVEPDLEKLQNKNTNFILQEIQQKEMELLGLQKEIREKQKNIILITSKYDQLHEKFNLLKQQHHSLIQKLSDQNRELEEEKKKNHHLSLELHKWELESVRNKEHLAVVEDLKQEITLLKEINQNLEKAIVEEQNTVESQKEKKYKTKIDDLEKQVEAWENTSHEQFLANKRLTDEMQQMKDTISQLESKENEAKEVKISMRKRVEIAEQSIEDQQKVIAYYQEREKKLENQLQMLQLMQKIPISKYDVGMQTIPPSLLDKATEVEPTISLTQEIQCELLQETEPKIVEKIVEKVVEKIVQIPVEKVVEKQMEQKSKIETNSFEISLLNAKESQVRFLATQNQMHFSLHSITLNSTFFESREHNLPLFISFDFYEHQTQSTPLFTLSPAQPNTSLNFTAEFEFSVNYFLLYYLQNYGIDIQLNQVRSNQDLIDYDTIASGSITLHPLLQEESHILAKGSTVTLYRISLLNKKTTDREIGTIAFQLQTQTPFYKCIEIIS